jgi:hypothetical protein
MGAGTLEKRLPQINRTLQCAMMILAMHSIEPSPDPLKAG